MMSENPNWTEALSLKLIEEYKMRPVLWDRKDPMYENETFYEEAWLDIANTMGIHHDKCMEHMTTILSRFEEKKQVKRSRDVPTQWFAWKALSFLEFPDYAKVKVLTGNYYYNQLQDTLIEEYNQAYVEPKTNDVLEGLDEESKTLVIDLVTKLKKGPQLIRSRIMNTIKDVLDKTGGESTVEVDLTID